MCSSQCAVHRRGVVKFFELKNGQIRLNKELVFFLVKVVLHGGCFCLWNESYYYYTATGLHGIRLYTHYVGCDRDVWWRWRYVVSTYLTFYVTPNINQLRTFETLFCTFLMPKNFNHKSLGNLTLKGSSPGFSKNRNNSVIEREQKYHDQREHVEETKKTLKAATSLINSIFSSSFSFLFHFLPNLKLR